PRLVGPSPEPPSKFAPLLFGQRATHGNYPKLFRLFSQEDILMVAARVAPEERGSRPPAAVSFRGSHEGKWIWRAREVSADGFERMAANPSKDFPTMARKPTF